MSEEMAKTVEDYSHEEKQLLLHKFFDSMEGDAKIRMRQRNRERSKMKNFCTPHNIKVDHKVMRVISTSNSVNVNRRDQLLK